jgi:hypothetical protein
MMLAESASAVDNKLNVVGGVVSTCRAGAERVVEPTLVVLIAPEPSDEAAKIAVRFTDPTGEALEEQYDLPQSSMGGEIGFVCYPLRLPVPVNGRYLLSVSARGGFVSLPLRVID